MKAKSSVNNIKVIREMLQSSKQSIDSGFNDEGIKMLENAIILINHTIGLVKRDL